MRRIACISCIMLGLSVVVQGKTTQQRFNEGHEAVAHPSGDREIRPGIEMTVTDPVVLTDYLRGRAKTCVMEAFPASQSIRACNVRGTPTRLATRYPNFSKV